MIIGRGAIAMLLCAVVGMATAQPSKDTESRLRSLEFKADSAQGRLLPYSTATVNCNTGGYTEFTPSNSALVMFAACIKVEPYLEGHQVTLDFGNPYTFNFTEVSGKLFYGQDMSDAFTRSVPITTTSVLRAGQWTRLVVVVNPSRADQMRHIEVSLRAGTASPGR